jgi:uncharacterized OB-fold protein
MFALDSMANDRNIRIYCPTHEAVFDAAESPKILCEITGHALSVDFPAGEFWEFCCNCETFAPSRLGKNEKARKTCYACGNETARRFLCESCSIVSFESDASTKRKNYSVNATVGIEPACAGCETSPRAGMLIHDCREAEAIFATTREICPFCLEKTAPAREQNSGRSVKTVTRIVPAADPGQCGRCGAWNPPVAAFCGKCKNRLRSDIAVANLGTDTNKTKLLGSLCPNCSTPVPPESDFCGECGQAVKKAPVSQASGEVHGYPKKYYSAGTNYGVAPPPPAPIKPGMVPEPSLSLSGKSEPFAKYDNFPVKAVGVIGVVVFVMIIIGIISSNKSVGNTSSNINTATITNARTGTNTAGTTPYLSTTPNTSSSDSRIGKTGVFTTDSNLRGSPGKDAAKVGTHYRGAGVKILDVQDVSNSDGTTSTWFKVQITSYGTSLDANNSGQSKDPGSQDIGWVNSYPEVYSANKKSKIRVMLIQFN